MWTEVRVRERLAAGDLSAAATEAIQGLGPDVLRYLRATLHDEDHAADAFSQFAENLWKGIAGYRAEASFKVWALRLAHNVAVNQRKEAFERRVRRLGTSEAARIAGEVRRTSGPLVDSRRRELDALRSGLSAEEQTLLVLRVEQELSWEEIAQIVSDAEGPVGPNALMKRFERMRIRLARLARERGLVD